VIFNGIWYCCAKTSFFCKFFYTPLYPVLNVGKDKLVKGGKRGVALVAASLRYGIIGFECCYRCVWLYG